MTQGLYKRFKCLKIFNEFLCIYLGEGKGGVLMHVYVLEHIISLSYRTTSWMFTKLDRDEVLIITHLFIGFWANSTQGRIQRGGGNLPKIGQWGVPSQKDFFCSLSYRTTWWMFTKLDRDEVLIITHLFIGFSANSTQGGSRGGGNLLKISQWGVPSPKDFFFRLECNSNKPNASPYPELKYCDCCCSDWFHKYGSHAFWFAKKSNF